jgi:hypothetical protein
MVEPGLEWFQRCRASDGLCDDLGEMATVEVRGLYSVLKINCPIVQLSRH